MYACLERWAECPAFKIPHQLLYFSLFVAILSATLTHLRGYHFIKSTSSVLPNRSAMSGISQSRELSLARFRRQLDVVSEHTILLPHLFDADRVRYAFENHTAQFGVDDSLRSKVNSVASRLRIAQLHAINTEAVTSDENMAAIKRKVNDWIVRP
jgi:hypothetical protein